jgi:NADH:ubiquinone oxidoreductase subunit K
MELSYLLIVSAIMFCTGIFGVIARKNGILVLMSVELMLNAVNLNFVAFSQYVRTPLGNTFALFVITIAAAEIGVGLGIVLLITRNLRTPNIDKLDQLKG